MSRFSPTVAPTSGSAAARFGQDVVAGMERFFAGRRQKREDEERQGLLEEDRRDRESRRESQRLADALREAEAYDIGVRRGAAPTRTEQLQTPELFRGQQLGLAPQQGGRQSPLAGALGELEGARVVRPKLVAPPGAIMPDGLGFADRPIYDIDLPAPDTRMGLQRPATRTTRDPRYVPLSDDRYLDTSATPGARKERETAAQRERVGGALQLLRDLSPEQATAVLDALEAGVPASQLFQDEEDPDVIDAGGRDFPNTPEGERAALEWLRQRRDATLRAPEGADAAAATSARQRAMAAARAVGQVQLELARNAVRPSAETSNRIRATLRLYGFRTFDELEGTMRSLGITEADVAPESAPSESGLSDRINELLDEGLDDTEIEQRLREEGLIGG